MRKILIPTDLSVASLKLAEHAFKIYENEVIDIIFIYPYRLPHWEMELYSFSPSRIISENTGDDFFKAKDELVNRYYMNINSILIKLFTGVNSMAFKNFTEYNKVKTALIPQKGVLNFRKGGTFDPIELIQYNIPEIHVIQSNKNDEEPYNKNHSQRIFNALKKAFQAT